MSEENGEKVEVGTGGIKISTRKGDLINLLNAAGLAVLLYGGWNHTVEARDDRMAFVQAIKENTRAMKESVDAQRVANCLNSLTPEQKKDERLLQFCKALDSR